jgi:hypothetical protein
LFAVELPPADICARYGEINRLCRPGTEAIIRRAVIGRRQDMHKHPVYVAIISPKLTYQYLRLHRYSLGFGTRQSGSVKRTYYCAAHVDARICSYLFHIVSHMSDWQAPASCLRTFLMVQGRGHIQGSLRDGRHNSRQLSGMEEQEVLTTKSAISLLEKLADHHRGLEEGNLKQYHRDA